MLKVDLSAPPPVGGIGVAEPVDGTGADGGYCEVRVHGIGDHGLLSAQGSGTLLDQTHEPGAEGISISAPPAAPDHRVRYLNWSRTSRSKVRLFWYFAFPYTLVNTAAFMCPRAGRGRQFHQVFVIAWGAVLTAATVLWVIAASETILRYVVDGRGAMWASFGVPLVIGSLIPLVIAVRAVKHRGEGRVAAGWEISGIALGVNFLAAAGVVAAVAIWTPARNTVPTRGGTGAAPCLVGPGGADCVVYRGDWLTIAALGTVGVAVLALLFLAVASVMSRDKTWQGNEASPLLGTGIALLAATVSLHVGWSSFLIAIQALLGYLAAWYFLPFLDRAAGTHPADGLLLPFDAGSLVSGATQAGYVYGPHLVAIVLMAPVVLVCLLAAICVALSAVERAVGRLLGVPAVSIPGLAAARRMHRWITATSGARLTALVGGATLMWALWLVAVVSFLDDPPPLGSPSALIAFFILMQHLLLVGFLLLALVGSLRKPLAVLGDLVGFWNISAHPLAALPYRNVVVSAIRKEVAGPRPVALVGHSQGSVLCFTALLERAREAADAGPAVDRGPANGRIDLVTCGSPIASLYGRFFPRFFGATEMQLVNTSVSSWRNFWRDTDPIATEVGAVSGDKALTDPPKAEAEAEAEAEAKAEADAGAGADAKADAEAGRQTGVLRGHGDYWVEKRQTSWIKRRAAAADRHHSGSAV